MLLSQLRYMEELGGIFTILLTNDLDLGIKTQLKV